MKWLFFVILTVFSLCCTGRMAAEVHYKPHISIGARAGMSMSEVSFSPSVRQSWSMGSCGALTFRYSEEKLFGFIAELGWTRRGWKENYEELPFSYSRSLTYLTLPVLTHIYFGGDRVLCFVNLGPSVSYLIGSSIDSNFDYHNPASVPDYPRNRRTEQLSMEIKNKFDYGISAGLGVEFRITPRNSVLLEGRFYYGLGNIYSATKSDVFSASRNMNIEVTLGYNFRLR